MSVVCHRVFLVDTRSPSVALLLFGTFFFFCLCFICWMGRFIVVYYGRFDKRFERVAVVYYIVCVRRLSISVCTSVCLALFLTVSLAWFSNWSQGQDQNRYDIQTKNTTDVVGAAIRYHCQITIPGNIMNHAVVWAENEPMFVSATKYWDEKNRYLCDYTNSIVGASTSRNMLLNSFFFMMAACFCLCYYGFYFRYSACSRYYAI